MVRISEYRDARIVAKLAFGDTQSAEDLRDATLLVLRFWAEEAREAKALGITLTELVGR